jgi:formamidopyrimidine-DNA glycosylase
VPEGDTVYLAATRLRAALAGKTLRRTDFRVPRLATVDLAGRSVDAVAPRGKHLFLRLSGGLTLHTHFRMDGAWHLYRGGERWRGPAWQVRAVLETDLWTAVGFQLPVLELLESAREAEVVAHLGPDPLAPDWDAQEALRRLCAQGERPIGEVLLDQRVIAGPGNIYKCEICFLRGLDPWTPVSKVREPERLIDLLQRSLYANRHIPGHVTTGDTRHGRQHWVYGRGGLPCRRCGTPIRKHAPEPGIDGERVTYWCPSCQRR